MCRCTPLIYAAQKGSETSTVLLLKFGADIRATDVKVCYIVDNIHFTRERTL